VSAMNTDVTRILERMIQRDPTAAGQLLPLVYDELRKLAAAKLAHEKPGQTLQATALVHEAYLRLVGGAQAGKAWDGRGHFFAAAAEAMRRILVGNARRKHRLRHGGGMVRVELDDELDIEAPEFREDLLALDAALDKLKQVDGTAAELVQLRYFAGLTLAEAAEMLDISTRSADRVWAYAKAWLHREITESTSAFRS
jgi:RNA polymerase sigma factor (TIGR02999 family)